MSGPEKARSNAAETRRGSRGVSPQMTAPTGARSPAASTAAGALQSGFTLLEIMVVVVLISLTVTLVSINLDRDLDQIAHREAVRFARLLEHVREESILTGKVYAIDENKKDKYLGWVDYESGEVFDEDNDLMGWVEDDGEVIGYYEDGEADLGYVTEDGEIYAYTDDEEVEVYLGKVREMQDIVEAAAAMLFFFEGEE